MHLCAILAFVACLTVSSSVDYADGEGVQAVINTRDCLLAINLARTSRLDHPVPSVQENEALGNIARSLLTTKDSLYWGATTDCSFIRSVSPGIVGTVVLVADNRKQPNEQTIKRLVQKQLTAGLKVLGDNHNAVFAIKAAPYGGSFAAQNIAYLLYSKSLYVGCAAASNCSAGNSVVVCAFYPTLQHDYTTPFSKSLLEDLQKRENAKVNLAGLSSADLNKPRTAANTVSPSPASGGPSPREGETGSNSSQDSQGFSTDKPVTPSSTPSPEKRSEEEPKGSGAAGSSVLPCVVVTLLFLIGLTVTH